MSYEEKEDINRIKKLIKQQRARDEVKQARGGNVDEAYKRWRKKHKAGETEYQKKIRKMLGNK